MVSTEIWGNVELVDIYLQKSVSNNDLLLPQALTRTIIEVGWCHNPAPRKCWDTSDPCYEHCHRRSEEIWRRMRLMRKRGKNIKK
jgi:hypothetical protein